MLQTNILKTLETSSSIGMFARDTGGCLVARLGLSRSKDESREISFAELSESALFYFSAPSLAKGTSNLFAKAYNIDKDQFKSSVKYLKNIDPKQLMKIKAGKFGQILTTFGVILPVIYAIAHVRNLLTYSETGKNKFTSVVGLENTDKTKKREEARSKLSNLAKKLGLISAGTITAGLGLTGLAKNPKAGKILEPIFDKTIKYFEFTPKGDLELAHYGALIYPASIAGYFNASRDKYEKMENARRFSITVPLLFFGEKLIQNPIHKTFDKIFKTNVMENGQIKSYKEILKMPDNKKLIKSKNWAYGLTFVINTMAIAAAVALLNRFETKRQFQKNNPDLLTNSNYQRVK